MSWNLCINFVWRREKAARQTDQLLNIWQVVLQSVFLPWKRWNVANPLCIKAILTGSCCCSCCWFSFEPGKLPIVPAAWVTRFERACTEVLNGKKCWKCHATGWLRCVMERRPGFAWVISRCRRSLKSWLLAVDCCFRGHRQLVLIIIPWISPHFSVIFTPLTRTPL